MCCWKVPVAVGCLVLCSAILVATEMTCGQEGYPSDVCTFDLRMKGAHPNRPDQYFCAGYDVKKDILGTTEDGQNQDGYVVRYEALADSGTAHHILVFGCERPYKSKGFWSCGSVCEGQEQIIFAWAKNAPPLSLPKDVGQRFGEGTNINHIVVQIHYAKTLDAPDYSGIRIYATLQRQQYLAGIFLLLAYSDKIPPQTKDYHMDASCRFNWKDAIVPFGFRTHAHSLGKVISGYKVSQTGGQYEMIGKGNPQWPQAFYPVENPVTIKPGDYLVARCTYDSTGRDRYTRIGSTSNDEMCNFYIMYYMNATTETSHGTDTCAGDREVFISQGLPAEASVPLPPNPALEEVATGHHHAGDVDEEPTRGDDIIKDIIASTPSTDPTPNTDLDLTFISSVVTMEIGQVGGVATSKSGDLYVFHRGDRVWNSLSFDVNNVYQLQSLPVATDAILVLSSNGTVKNHFGKNRFFLPHGLSLDKDENVWVTDVALHQVFRIPKGTEVPDLTLGIRFEPGNDREHFCKPSDVAVLSNGDFFVSDGYCNTRIVQFDKNGYFLKEWGSADMTTGADGFPPPASFSIPHGLALAEDKGLLCVADRENGRIQCFDLSGNFVRQMHPMQFGRSLYALEYCPKHGGILFAVNGPVMYQTDPVTQGFTLDINTGQLLSTWNLPGKGMNHPHDVTVDTERHLVYVGELNPSKVWKFEMSKALYAANTSSNAGTSAPVAGSVSDTVAKTTTTEKSIAHLSSSNTPLVVTVTPVSQTATGDLGPVLETENQSWGVHDDSPGQGQILSTGDNTGVTDSGKTVKNNREGQTKVTTGSVASSVDVVVSEVREDTPPSPKKVEGSDDFAPSLIIGTLLVVPVVLLIIVTILVRLYQTGHFRSCNRRNSGNHKFNLGNLLNPHKGFDRLSTEDDDHDLENMMDDSDNEEFSIVRKA